MVVFTDKGNFGSFSDLLLDMRIEGYQSVFVSNVSVVCNQINLGGIIGQLSQHDVELIVNKMV